MEPVIDNMLENFEKGRLSRRALVQGLTALMAAVAAPEIAKAADSAPAVTGPLKATNVDHVSILTSDLQKSIDFYKDIFGFNALSEDKEHKIMRMGPGKKIILSLRQQEPYGKVDHFGFHVEGMDRKNMGPITEYLKSKGLDPKTDWEFGYHFLDPNGVVIQLV